MPAPVKLPELLAHIVPLPYDHLDGAILSKTVNAYGNFIVASCQRERTEQDDLTLEYLAHAANTLPELLEACKRFIDLGKAGADTSWHSEAPGVQDTFYRMMRAIAIADRTP